LSVHIYTTDYYSKLLFLYFSSCTNFFLNTMTSWLRKTLIHNGRFLPNNNRSNKQKLVVATTTCCGCGSYYLMSVRNFSFPPASINTMMNTTDMEAPKRNNRAAIDAVQTKDHYYLPTRSEQITKLKQASNKDQQPFDVIVVGGGATGCGAALDAQTRGLSTALIERADFGNETSARSTKLIWAGIRYIATAIAGLLRFRNLSRPIDAVSDFTGEFKMVLGAHKERRVMLENNPHLTNWVPIAIPMTSWISWPAPFGHPLFASAPLTLPLVFKFYDSLSGFTCPPSHIMQRARALRKFPQLSQDAKYFQVFYEGQHDDARTNTYIALTAAEKGAAVANYVEMIDLLKDENTGKAIGVKCRDNMSGEEFNVYSKAVVFAGGPFTDELRKLEDPDCKPAVNAAAGTHIVLPGYMSPSGIGMLDINTSDGRFLFFLPWQGHTVVGTTDRKGPVTSYHGPPEEEIEWLLNEVQKYLSDDIRVRRSDVLSAWQGFRPLASDPNALPGAPISRDHIVSVNPETNVTFITGGKWVTYREMAEDVIDRVIDLHKLNHAGPCVTDKIPLRGGEGYNRNVPIQLVQKYGVSEATAKHLACAYGMHAFEVCELAEPTTKTWPRFGNLLLEGFPYLECEIAYVCRNEMVCTLTDMLTLRTRLAYLNKDAALAIAPKMADLMAKEMNWSRSEKKRQLEEAMSVLKTFGGPFPSKEGMEQKFKSVNDVRALFKSMDHSGNGYIDFIEFKGVLDALGLPFANDKAAMNAFRNIDTDKNGKILEDDFIAWWENASRLDSLKSNLSQKFKLSAEKLRKDSGVGFG